MYITRAIEEKILQTAKTFPVLLVTGPRQVGKTTLLKHLAEKERAYVTLDDPEIRSIAKNDPALFMQIYQPPILIDEIQYAPEILPYIKMHVDQSKKTGEFWLTGSQIFHMMKNVSESLAGRVGIHRLLSLSNSEINGVKSVAFTTASKQLMERVKQTQKMNALEVFERIVTGGMPAMYNLQEQTPDLTQFYSSYLTTYLQRDIRDLTQVANEMDFFHFMTAVAARTARPVNYNEIAKEVGISAPTAKKWLSILISTQIVVLVQPYYNNVLKRLTRMPLLHFLDTGLCSHLLKWKDAETLINGPMAGQLFESWVFSEIYKSYLNAGIEPPIYYYRDKEKHEIDLLIVQNGMISPIEIKKTASPKKHTIQHFSRLEPITEPEKFGGLQSLKMEIGEGAVICMANQLLPIDQRNWSVPVWLI